MIGVGRHLDKVPSSLLYILLFYLLVINSLTSKLSLPRVSEFYLSASHCFHFYFLLFCFPAILS